MMTMMIFLMMMMTTVDSGSDDEDVDFMPICLCSTFNLLLQNKFDI